MDPRLEKLMKDTVHFLKEDLEEENLSYDCQLKKDWLIKTIQHVWNETKYDVSIHLFSPIQGLSSFGTPEWAGCALNLELLSFNMVSMGSTKYIKN